MLLSCAVIVQSSPGNIANPELAGLLGAMIEKASTTAATFGTCLVVPELNREPGR